MPDKRMDPERPIFTSTFRDRDSAARVFKMVAVESQLVESQFIGAGSLGRIDDCGGNRSA